MLIINYTSMFFMNDAYCCILLIFSLNFVVDLDTNYFLRLDNAFVLLAVSSICFSFTSANDEGIFTNKVLRK